MVFGSWIWPTALPGSATGFALGCNGARRSNARHLTTYAPFRGVHTRGYRCPPPDDGLDTQGLSLATGAAALASRPVNQFTAYCTSCVPVFRFNLRLIRCRCDSTVLILRFKDSAVSRVLMPLPIMC